MQIRSAKEQLIANQRRRKSPKGDDRKDFCKGKSLDAKMWIFCEQVHEIEKPPKIQTLEQAPIIRMMATGLQDIEILTGGDVIALKAECLTRLRNHCRSFQRK